MVDGALLAYSRKRKPSDKPKAPDPPPFYPNRYPFWIQWRKNRTTLGKTLSDDDEESDLTFRRRNERLYCIRSGLIPLPLTTPELCCLRAKTHTKVLDSDEEDPSALQTGDSMFSSSSGVKASAKQRQREDAADSSLEIVESPTKDGKRKSGKRAEDTPDRPSGSLNKDQEKETLTIAGSDRLYYVVEVLSAVLVVILPPLWTLKSADDNLNSVLVLITGPLLAQHVMANLMPTVKTAIRDSVAALVPSSSASKLGPLEPSPMLIEDKQQGTSNVKQASDEQTKPIMPVVPPYSSLNTVEEFLDPPSAEMLDIASTAVADPASTEVLDLSDMFISKGGLSPEKSSAHSDGELDKPSQGEPVKTDGTTAIDLLKDAIPIGPDVTCLDDLESYKNRLIALDIRVLIILFQGGEIHLAILYSPNSNDNLDHVWFSRWDLANINQVVLGMRINIENKTAIGVSPGMCMESQEWERWGSFHVPVLRRGTTFHCDDEMRILVTARFPSMLSPTTSTPTKRQRPSGPPSSPAWQNDPNRVRYALGYDDEVPVYDATSKDFDFRKDLSSLSTMLPKWRGEIPKASFIVAGYTAVSYSGNAAGMTKQPHVGCNLLWAVLL
ncbi:hypothetical protein B0H11DRAFT_1940802 [Mycena galericulata]|nr:hypothetical protein B0H11DRAFT_1940802 [Mycena galericulata]